MSESMSEENKNPNPSATLAGGVDLAVTLKSGATETVKVIEIAVEDYPALFAAINDEQRQVEIFCAKPAGWAKTLTPKSHNAVMERGEELNKEPFFGWCARRIDKGMRLAPAAARDLVNTAMREALQNGSLKSP